MCAAVAASSRQGLTVLNALILARDAVRGDVVVAHVVTSLGQIGEAVDVVADQRYGCALGTLFAVLVGFFGRLFITITAACDECRK